MDCDKTEEKSVQIYIHTKGIEFGEMMHNKGYFTHSTSRSFKVTNIVPIESPYATFC